jgi:thiol:disulfide interchange protein DsbC
MTFSVTAVLMSTLYAVETVVDPAKFPDLKKMNVVLQDPVLSIEGAIEKPESYILKLMAKSQHGSQNITAFLNKKTSELYIGSAYDKEGNTIEFPKDPRIIKDGVAFSYGKGSKDIYLVTDPECPYCSKFEKAAKGKLDDYTVHVILFPLSFHKKSPAMTEWIMLGKDDAEKKARFEEVMFKGSKKYAELIKDAKKPFVYSAEAEVYIKKSKAAAREMNMRGTPALYDAEFNPLSQDEVLNISINKSQEPK